MRSKARILALSLLLIACRSRDVDSSAPRGSASAQTPESIQIDRATRLSGAERRRDANGVERDWLSSRELATRRLAARALSRIADAASLELLAPALADEDPEVVTWAAYGLGYGCHGREAKTVRALVARAASLSAPPPSPSATEPVLASPIEAISDALGRCAGADAEASLRAWLHGPAPRAEAAALGLGRIASQTGKLEDTTLVALLDAADQLPNPLQNALYPLTRLAALNTSTADRALDIAKRLASTPKGVSAEFAVRVLSRTGEAGYAALATLFENRQLSSGLRAQAARELGTLGAAGQHDLWSAFDSALASTPSDADLSGEAYAPFSALLDALRPPLPSSAAKLQGLANWSIDAASSATANRRKVHVRCTAAALLAGSNFKNALLLACDPAQSSRERELAQLRVLGREKLRGARKALYLDRARSNDNVVRETALDLLAEHNELREAYQLLAEALAQKSWGVVAAAARVLSAYPERAARTLDASGDAHSAPNPDPSVVAALTHAYADAGSHHKVEIQSLLLDAIGALQILTLKDAASAACGSDNPTLREHAQKALHLLGEQARRCDAHPPAKASGSDSPLRPHATPTTVLTFETDAGELSLTLDWTYAPTAVEHMASLAQVGFYNGLLVHRVVPGFVAQFGDPQGDGYGGDDDSEPLRCETSPIPFQVGSVGVALAGRDTGSSQIFVTLGRYPHLDGQYAWLGQAGPGWDRVAAGDRIIRVSVNPPF